MFNKLWQSKEGFNNLYLGGNNQDILNEHIVVDQKTQKKLKYIVRKLLPSNDHSDLKYLINKQSQLESYLLNIILGQTRDTCTRRLHTNTDWSQKKVTGKPEVKFNVPKEKIEITKECQEAIKNIIPTKGKDRIYFQNEFISECDLSKYKLITLGRREHKRKVKSFLNFDSTWNSKIELDMKDLVNEKLLLAEYIDIRISGTIEFRYLNAPQLQDFLIPLTDRRTKTEYNKNNAHSDIWDIKEPASYPLELFYNLERSLFDDTFHDLEFYLIRIKNHKINQHKEKRNNCRSKNIWKLDKQLLKSIDWNPFKKINDKSIHYFNNLENIKQVSFQIPLDIINFNYLNSSSFDLIDVQNKIFNSYQTGLNETCCAITIPTERAISAEETAMSSLIAESNDDTSRETVNTSLIPQKRSLLDPSILSIIHAKKSKRKSLDNASQHKDSKIQDTLSFGINKHLDSSITETSWNSQDHNVAEQFVLTLPKCSFKIVPKVVVVNASKLLINHSIIYELRSSHKCEVIERKISLMCDFIISSDCCITRIKLENFQQCDSNGRLYYCESFKQLTKYFKKIIVLVDYGDVTEQTDPDLFWKIGLFLNLHPFQVHLINRTNNTKCRDQLMFSYILKYINKLSPSTQINFSDTIGNSDFEFLCKITNNPLLSQDILTQQTLLEFFKNVQLSKTYDEFPITKMLTHWQWMSLRNLFAVTW